MQFEEHKVVAAILNLREEQHFKNKKGDFAALILCMAQICRL